MTATPGRCAACGSPWPQDRDTCPRCPPKKRKEVLMAKREAEEAARLAHIRADRERNERALRHAIEAARTRRVDQPAPVMVPDTWKRLENLGFICRIENLPSILERGILSYNEAQSIDHISLADETIQGYRDRTRVTGTAFSIHDCANAYINPRNAMLYRIVHDDRHRGRACVIRINAPMVLNLPGCIVSDRNAASSGVSFAPPAQALANMDWNEVMAKSWHGNEVRKARMMAEVLVPGDIPPTAIMDVHVATEGVVRRVSEITDGVAVTVNRRLFFE